MGKSGKVVEERVRRVRGSRSNSDGVIVME